MTLNQWFQAAKSGDCAFLLQNKQSHQTKQDQQFPKSTALIYAVENNQSAAAKLLIASERGKQNFYGWTALHTAIFNSNVQLTKLLSPYEKSIQTKSSWKSVPSNTSPLQLAMQLRNDQLVEILSEEHNGYILAFQGNFSINGPDSIGRTSLHYLALANTFNLSESQFQEMYNQLGKQFDNLGKTALMLASEANNQEFFRYANIISCEFQIQINSRENDLQRGNTAMMLAAELGNLDVVQLLRESEIRLTNFQGVSALMLAAKKGHVQIVRELMQYEKGFQTTIQSQQIPKGTTALMFAFSNQHHECVQVLIPYEQEIQNSFGQNYREVEKLQPRLSVRESMLNSSQIPQENKQFFQAQLEDNKQSPRPNKSIYQQSPQYNQQSSSNVQYQNASSNGVQLSSAQSVVQQCQSCVELKDDLTKTKRQLMKINQQVENSILDDDVNLIAFFNEIIAKFAGILNKAPIQEVSIEEAGKRIFNYLNDLTTNHSILSPKEIDQVLGENKMIKEGSKRFELVNKTLTNQINDIQQENDILQRQLTDYKKQNDLSTSTCSKFKDDYNKLQMHLAEANMQQARINEIFDLGPNDNTIQQLLQIKNEHAALLGERNTFQQELDKIVTYKDKQINDLSKEKDIIQDLYCNLQEEISSIDQELQKEKEKNFAQRERQLQLQDKCAVLEHRNNQFMEQKDKFVESLKHYKNIVDQFKQLLQVPYSEDIVQDLEEFISKQDNSQQISDLLLQEKDQLQQFIQEKELVINEQNKQIQDLQNKANAAQATNLRTMHQFKQLQGALQEQQNNFVKIFEEGSLLK
ncbi:Ankyrin repeat-containing protein [Spironucleus salmonicida]|uniref:Ankyrin repeat-containing protein n=1 Tax=Spironucleus salmonicida TaxID=348837 RepID=V6LZM0_9EUKA|nr:Ankyrin repeat-containing protein [Spironucleus salmonicida]|eukprot:EST49186.1 Ankyrin repeat-containing protein [Spironucleus salmonicida]